MRYALVLEYDGSGFCGWQSQTNGATVQDVVEAALSAVADQATRVVCAGRTDTGVHALAQVVHFDSEVSRPMTAWVRGTNALLPTSVAIRHAQAVSDDFHARFSAIGRHYRYILLNRPQRPGLASGRVGWYHRSLELLPMQAAAAMVVGEHDFSAFRSSECQAKSPVRQLRSFSVRQEGDFFVFALHGNAFLHHMVRNLIGSLVAIGSGKQAPSWMAELLNNRDRSAAAATFSPAGLYLSGVDYDSAWNLKVGAGGTALLHDSLLDD
jgi:tRNA pseudouridine38-40 synthase